MYSAIAILFISFPIPSYIYFLYTSTKRRWTKEMEKSNMCIYEAVGQSKSGKGNWVIEGDQLRSCWLLPRCEVAKSSVEVWWKVRQDPATGAYLWFQTGAYLVFWTEVDLREKTENEWKLQGFIDASEGYILTFLNLIRSNFLKNHKKLHEILKKTENKKLCQKNQECFLAAISSPF